METRSRTSVRRWAWSELVPRLMAMDAATQEWILAEFLGLVQDVAADLLLQQALGDKYEPMDLSRWRPESPPPGADAYLFYKLFDARQEQNRNAAGMG
jgi:hypothetical protein